MWLLRRQIVSPDPYCELDGRGPESWKVEHCHDHPCPATLAAWILTPLVILLLAGLAVVYYKRGFSRLQRGIPLRTFPTTSSK